MGSKTAFMQRNFLKFSHSAHEYYLNTFPTFKPPKREVLFVGGRHFCQTQIPISSKGTGADTKILGHPTPAPPPPTTLKGCEKVYMVHIEAPSNPGCQDSIPSQGGQLREEHK